MASSFNKYQKAIESELTIVTKEGEEIPFKLNRIQERYLNVDSTGHDVILKARQQGFSSLVLGIFTIDFLLKPNTRSVIVTDVADNAIELLDRVKFYIRSYEAKNGYKVPLKYNSKHELYNENNNSRYTIGTADNTDFGRSKTISNLHLSEFAFYNNPEKLLASALQAVTPEGRAIIETTACGFNFFKTFWDECVRGERSFNPLFYPAKDFYDEEFLKRKQKELGRLYTQEYPNEAVEAFLTSGSLYFDSEALKHYLSIAKEGPESHGLIYA